MKEKEPLQCELEVKSSLFDGDLNHGIWNQNSFTDKKKAMSKKKSFLKVKKVHNAKLR